jgi:hypothetical protein
MEEYAVDIEPGEVLQWVHADASRKAPSLWVRTSKEYQVDPEFDCDAAGIGEEDVVPAVVRGLMEIEPKRGQHGWTLQVRAEDSIGLRPVGEDEGYADQTDMVPDDFEAEFLTPERGDVEVVVLVEDAPARQRFRRWVAGQRAFAGSHPG